eukprot:751156-Hanusia_phi.AAC.1
MAAAIAAILIMPSYKGRFESVGTKEITAGPLHHRRAGPIWIRSVTEWSDHSVTTAPAVRRPGDIPWVLG